MAKSCWRDAPKKPPVEITPDSQMMFGSAPWSPQSEVGPGEDCQLCQNGSRLPADTTCGVCLRSDKDELIARVLASEGLPPKETAKSLKAWEALPVEERLPARRPIFITKFTPSDN